MTAPTVAVEWLLARAAVRATGLLHIVSRRDSGALNPICGANPIRSTTIETPPTLDDAGQLCVGCAAIATSLGGTVLDGVALFLGRNAGGSTLQLLEVPLDRIRVTAGRTAPDEALVELAQSIVLHGVLQPVLLRHTAAGLEIVSGHRRIAASALAGRASVLALVREISDTAAVLASLTENLHRVDLNPIEQAAAYAAALSQLSCTQEQLAQYLCVSRPVVANTLRLLNLAPEVKAQVAAGVLSAAHGRALLRVADPDEQAALAAQWIADGTSSREAERTTATAPARPRPEPLADISTLLAALLDARVMVTAGKDRKRVVIDVADADFDRLLEQLRAAA